MAAYQDSQYHMFMHSMPVELSDISSRNQETLCKNNAKSAARSSLEKSKSFDNHWIWI